jgi:hypothetical protein
MLMMIRYQDGLRSEAVLLAASRERMRIATATQRDTLELHQVDGCWLTDAGDEIEIEALIPLAGTGVPTFCAAINTLSNTAGNGYMVG